MNINWSPRYVIQQFAKVLPNDIDARRAFVQSGSLQKVQEARHALPWLAQWSPSVSSWAFVTFAHGVGLMRLVQKQGPSCGPRFVNFAQKRKFVGAESYARACLAGLALCLNGD